MYPIDYCNRFTQIRSISGRWRKLPDGDGLCTRRARNFGRRPPHMGGALRWETSVARLSLSSLTEFPWLVFQSLVQVSSSVPVLSPGKPISGIDRLIV